MIYFTTNLQTVIDILFNKSFLDPIYCTACQYLPLRQKFMECIIINPALLKHLVIPQCQKAPIFLAFRWSPHDSLVSIGQHFVTTRVVHLLKRTETSLITKSDRSGPNHLIRPGCAPNQTRLCGPCIAAITSAESSIC